MYSFSNLFRIPKPDISRLGQKLIKSYSSWGQPPSCKNHSAFMDLCWCCWKMKFIPQDNFGLNTELELGWNWSPATSASLSLKAKWLRSCIISSQARIRKLLTENIFQTLYIYFYLENDQHLKKVLAIFRLLSMILYKLPKFPVTWASFFLV